MRKIAITLGDPAGIGPEVALKYFSQSNFHPSEYVIIGCSAFQLDFQSLGIEFIPTGSDFKPVAGDPSIDGAESALEALEIAANGCVNGIFSSVVTLPISKEWMLKAGFKHPGHTEFFEEKWGGDAVMAFVGNRMKVVLTTWHIPFCEVPSALNQELLRRSVAAAEQICRAFAPEKSGTIAVCGLNPHAGENGILGKEEFLFINDWIKDLGEDFDGVSGTYPADTVFWRHLRGDFDAVVALYHDQGLIPLKTLEFDSAVNVTMGLPYVRTSPDHGTGFDIAGKGIANLSSFSHAIEVAKKLEDYRNVA